MSFIFIWPRLLFPFSFCCDGQANFYFDTPVFRHHSTQSIEPIDGTDIEEQLESIGTANQLSDRAPVQSTNSELPSVPETSSAVVTEEEQAEDPQECFFSLLLTSQSRRMDEQRCCLRTTTPPSSSSDAPTAVTGAQANVSMHISVNEGSARPVVTTSGRLHLDPVSDEALFDLIEGVQVSRISWLLSTISDIQYAFSIKERGLVFHGTRMTIMILHIRILSVNATKVSPLTSAIGPLKHEP
ncbi:hypothetical protein AHF37_11680 [Paragonimus kellicotti]|nr:hypothetical protein AHF37_11680 [Paragonimus kellicotti]